MIKAHGDMYFNPSRIAVYMNLERERDRGNISLAAVRSWDERQRHECTHKYIGSKWIHQIEKRERRLSYMHKRVNSSKEGRQIRRTQMMRAEGSQ